MKLRPEDFAKDWHDPDKPWNRPGATQDAELIRKALDEDQQAADAQEAPWSPNPSTSSVTPK